MSTSIKKKRLGRGLDALLSQPAAAKPPPVGSQEEVAGMRNIPVDLLRRGQFQPRVDMRQDTLEELAKSIRAQGVVQPIVARPLANTGGTQHYEIIAGERRWRAAQLAGLQEIPAVIRDVPDESAIAMALIENIQRENLNPLEEATALHRLISEFELTHQEAAEAVGRSRASVSNLLRLLELADKVKALLESRAIEMGHARALLSITDKHRQFEAAREVVDRNLSVRQTEQLVRRMLSASAGGRKTAQPEARDKDIQRLEMELADRLGAKIRIDHSKSGRGKLVIDYNSLDELDGILKHIR